MKMCMYAALLLSLSSCAGRWTGPGAELAVVVEETRGDIEGGNKGREYIGADSRAERSKIEAKLLRAQGLKGTKAGDLHWAALGLLTQMTDVPGWATRLSLEATALTPDGLASWEQAARKDEPGKEKKKKEKKGEGPVFEGVSSMLKLSRAKAGEPWHIADVDVDIEGPRFAPFAEKKPFKNGAALTAAEANDEAFDAAFLAASPPFEARALVRGFGEALVGGEVQAFSAVAAPEGKRVDDLAGRLAEASAAAGEWQGILGESPAFVGLPAGTVALKVTLRGEAGQRVSYTIKKTKEGYRLTSLKAKTTKSGFEFDLKAMASDPSWSLKK